MTASRRRIRWPVSAYIALGLLAGLLIFCCSSAMANEGGTEPLASGETKPKAYSGNACWIMQGGHASEIKALINDLGYDTLKEEPPTKASAAAAAPNRLVWYSYSDGYVEVPSLALIALCFGYIWTDYFYPSDLPGGLGYTLVFLNACGSANGPVATQFADAFGATAYMGYLRTINNGIAVQFAQGFFPALKGHHSVQEAINTVTATYTPGGFSETEVVGNLTVLRGGGTIVEL